MAVKKHLSARCAHCGHRPVNPKWLRWKRQQSGMTLRETARFGLPRLSQTFLSAVERGRLPCPDWLLGWYEALPMPETRKASNVAPMDSSAVSEGDSSNA